MKKTSLSFMAVTIISLVIVLIINTMAIFAYRDEILTLENHKASMLHFHIKYSNLLDDLLYNTKSYLQTGDETYQSEFYSLLNNYMTSSSISQEYRVLPRSSFGSSLKEIQFNQQEQKLYLQFLDHFHRMIDLLTAAVEGKNSSIVISASFDTLYNQQSQFLNELLKSYIGKLNQKEDMVFSHQKVLEYSLVIVCLLLLGFSTVTFYMILKENAFHSYFSKLYNTVVENIDGGIAIFDKNYRFDYANAKYKEILGLPFENPIGKTLQDTLDHRIIDPIENTAMDVLCGEKKVELMIGNKKKYISCSSFPIYDEQGSSKYVHLLRDNTTTEELQQQLRRQLKEINFYSQAKDAFIANISHEIKTPINAILGMVHFLKSTKLSKNQKELVRKIETSSDILLTIISDVLDLSKIKNNALSLYPSDFSLEVAIKNVEDMFFSQLSFKGLRWQTAFHFNKNLCLHLDKTRFVQVLVNLINNACKFTDSGYVKLTVEALSEDEDTVQLQFCVEDTGMGIADKDISKLFREFEQLENHLTKQHQGTGLGLYICKNIIESMGGRIWVKSTEGVGSKFYFSIPAKKALYPGLNAEGDVMNPIPLDGNGGKALVVEDTEINAEVAVKLLNDVNIACDTAADGLAAVRICENKPANYYNVILMDIHMPNMDGYTAANILKKEMGITSPIIALTASDISDKTKADHADTIKSFILKPFKADAFYKAIAPYFPMKGTEDPFADRDEAIKNLGGLESIYYKHVEKFKANYAGSTEQITSFLKKNDFEEAARLAHSIKGLSGTLGMPGLMEASAELEKAIQRGEDYNLNIELEHFDRQLKAAINAI